ncbi:hypothetical protein FHT86_003525 [Rhizobium sp. BK313]|uniref:hypothetical protein n=1 Tax=Rhizobium sp. BK313 TaxID=2587081 RepID=UPI0010612933|nr:hypothetical protein [Rhizobium sp. BK313]MBB3455226.1 hypothetical protein [Rhizobium sp. BK313]
MADINAALDKLMADAIFQAQGMVRLMTLSCPGGEHGLNPSGYEGFVNSSNEVGRILVDLRLQLARGEVSNAAPQIDAVENTLEQMIGMVHNGCSGGPSGRDPFHYGDVINIKQRVLGSLDAVKAILGA